MRTTSLILLFTVFLSGVLRSQLSTITLSTELFDDQNQIQLAVLDGWVYHEAFNPSWLNDTNDFTDWQQMRPDELTDKFADNTGRVEGLFMLQFKLDESFEEMQLYLDRNLWAATEVYLDGQLVESFGQTGYDRSDFHYYNPNHKIPIELNLRPGKVYKLGYHIVNYESFLTPGKVKFINENLSNLINLTGPEHVQLEEHYQRSSYIHSTLWISLSAIFMLLFWMMSFQVPDERVFKLIFYLSLIIFIVSVTKSLLNFYELSFAQEKARYLVYGFTGPLINILVLIVTEWIIIRRSTILTYVLFAVIPFASVFAHLTNISIPFGLVNSIVFLYYFYLIIRHARSIDRVEWPVITAMSFYMVAVNVYLILRKVSMKDFLTYGNLIFTIILLVPLVALLIYVSLRFKQIIKQKLDAQNEINKQLQAINAASAKFVPSQFLNFLGKNNILDATLGDYAENQVTVMFSDIRDYTGLSEKMSPEENFRFVNAFNRRMGPIIQNNNGFINQYLGDGIMAIFPENPEDTLKAAIHMQRELQTYNKERSARAKVPINIGIGLHSGPLVMGIIGDDNRMDAATISDTVNVASRIEGLTKYFGARILLSEASMEKISNPESYHLRYLGIVQVKGKEKAVKIYECFDGDDPESIDKKNSTSNIFRDAIRLYYAKNFGEAAKLFHSITDSNPKDQTAQLYLQKSRYNLNNGIDEEWTGIEKMAFK